MFGRVLLALVLVAGAFAVLSVRSAGAGGICDGTVPQWMWVSESVGCVERPAPLEYVYPWHWFAPDVCLGMCGYDASGRAFEPGEVVE